MRGRAKGKYKKDGTCVRLAYCEQGPAPGKKPFPYHQLMQYEEENEQARTCVTPLSTRLSNFPRCPLAMHTQTHAYTNTNTQLELKGDSCHFFR